MAYIEWNDSYSIGVKAMDDQHKKLVDIINQLHDAMKAGQASKEAPNILKELIEYTSFHFGAEENLIKKESYPDFQNHKKLHEDLVQQINKYQAEIATKSMTIGVKLSEFLKDWLLTHILDEDMKYGKFLNNKGIR
jgi:hemerythrin